ncbi:exosortase B [Azohydromonas caseinilytica]|uniref:Exosortase B n=1 Tax=Azohydromonas caseinilytica TaxID=2728836 RepID=A0A848FEN2_9BURK|nr:exosortase B [Azohydromonas caseinilytica]NML17526.1 exosortase B [Azohydromonas caseinilytica]
MKAPALSGFPVAAQWWPFALLCLGFGLLYLPTFADLSRTIWASDEQGHGPIILVVSYWLAYRKRHELMATPAVPRPLAGALVFAVGWFLYVFGRSQSIIAFEVGSQIFLWTGVLLIFRGFPAVRILWFPLFFLIFMAPLPGAVVAALTAPLKSAVSTVAETVLYSVGYPVARTGAMLSIGQYQLFVADACAGLNSMFTLESLGLLYMNLMNYKSVARNVALAICIIPISFCANVIRVMILVLVTYHFGDAAGQGFIHGFAGLVLFLVALVLMLAVDYPLGRLFPERRAAA